MFERLTDCELRGSIGIRYQLFTNQPEQTIVFKLASL